MGICVGRSISEGCLCAPVENVWVSVCAQLIFKGCLCDPTENVWVSVRARID